MPGLSGVANISAGNLHTCAALTDGSVRCWGDNTFGQLGNDSTVSSPVPVSPSGLGGVESVAAGGDNTCVLITDGTARCWGSDDSGQVGSGVTGGPVLVPVPVTGLSTIVALTVGQAHACALFTSTGVSCWGQNNVGQLGNGSTISSAVPVGVDNLSGAVSVVAGFDHNCAHVAGATDAVVCWGNDGQGQLGVGSPIVPPQLIPSQGVSIGRVTDISAGASDSCAVVTDGTAWCWGDNTFGQLGSSPTGNIALSPSLVLNFLAP